MGDDPDLSRQAEAKQAHRAGPGRAERLEPCRDAGPPERAPARDLGLGGGKSDPQPVATLKHGRGHRRAPAEAQLQTLGTRLGGNGHAPTAAIGGPGRGWRIGSLFRLWGRLRDGRNGTRHRNRRQARRPCRRLRQDRHGRGRSWGRRGCADELDDRHACVGAGCSGDDVGRQAQQQLPAVRGQHGTRNPTLQPLQAVRRQRRHGDGCTQARGAMVRGQGRVHRRRPDERQPCRAGADLDRQRRAHGTSLSDVHPDEQLADQADEERREDTHDPWNP